MFINPAERLGTVPYNLVARCSLLVSTPLSLFVNPPERLGTAPCCRDCSPNSPKRKAARSGTAPYSLVNPAERLGTVPYSLVARCSSLVNPAERLGTVPYNRYYMLAM